MPTPHRTHTAFRRSCSVCRWEHMTPDEQAAYRAARSAQAAAAWRRQNPERAARRDAILAGRVPEPCDSCGTTADVRAFVTDYAQGVVIWRCRACARATRQDVRQEAA